MARDLSHELAADLAMAERHVREAEARVRRQTMIVERLQRQGTRSEHAEALLAHMRTVLADFYRHLWWKLDEATGAMRWVRQRPDPLDPQLHAADESKPAS
jgi:hypothetical protein